MIIIDDLLSIISILANTKSLLMFLQDSTLLYCVVLTLIIPTNFEGFEHQPRTTQSLCSPMFSWFSIFLARNFTSQPDSDYFNTIPTVASQKVDQAPILTIGVISQPSLDSFRPQDPIEYPVEPKITQLDFEQFNMTSEPPTSPEYDYILVVVIFQESVFDFENNQPSRSLPSRPKFPINIELDQPKLRTGSNRSIFRRDADTNRPTGPSSDHPTPKKKTKDESEEEEDNSSEEQPIVRMKRTHSSTDQERQLVVEEEDSSSEDQSSTRNKRSHSATEEERREEREEDQRHLAEICGREIALVGGIENIHSAWFGFDIRKPPPKKAQKP
ncbi:hypothetical protein BLNAU_6754 [Blattamonas nauphoetae]|uniref:Uncharacterized protein n=1 Tax=Blattamonas nauphoetae TaxID=2049346 RepID=A0ABQ9Y3D8_9EUKA|nr:hypothetical protein BLNAU_6754 [Blattamonas nauphoetae]